MILPPSIEEQRKFVLLFFRIGAKNSYEKISEMIENFTTLEVKKVAVSIVPQFLEMTFSEAEIDEMLSAENLPPYVAFKKLNSKTVKRILNKKRKLSGDDILLVKDALENNLLSGAEMEKAQRLISVLDL